MVFFAQIDGMAMDGSHRLNELQRRVAQVVRALPGATALYLFGSRITQPTDPYADLDLQILTDDLVMARRCWPHFLEHVAPIRVAWPMQAVPDTTAFAILFQGESFYHKVDIGLSPTTERTRYAATDGPYRALWEQTAPSATPSRPATHAFMPAYGTVGHALMNDLIGSVRYVKARKRHQPLTCWRFLRGKPDLLLQLYAEQQRHWQEDMTPLSTWDYKALDHQGTVPFLEAVLSHLNWATPKLMDANFYWFTQHIAQLFLEKAATQQEAIPPLLVADHLAFLATELQV